MRFTTLREFIAVTDRSPRWGSLRKIITAACFVIEVIFLQVKSFTPQLVGVIFGGSIEVTFIYFVVMLGCNPFLLRPNRFWLVTCDFFIIPCGQYFFSIDYFARSSISPTQSQLRDLVYLASIVYAFLNL